MAPNHESLGRAELELLQWIHDNHPISVGEAAGSYGAPRELARTTVQTMMQRLVAKGFLKRKKGEQGYVYSPVVSQSKVMSSMIKDFVQGVLGGSVSPFVAYLSESKSLSNSEIEQLRDLVAKLESSSTPSKTRDTKGTSR